MLLDSHGRELRRAIGFFRQYVIEGPAPQEYLTLIACDSIDVGEAEDMLETCETCKTEHDS